MSETHPNYWQSNGNFASGGLRPVDTITSSKNAHYQASVHRDRSGLVLKKDSPIQTYQFTQREPHPPKRRRTRSPERSIEFLAGPVSRSHDVSTRSPNLAVTRARKTSFNEAGSTSTDAPHAPQARPTALRNIHLSHPNKPKEDRRDRRQNSPDDLFDENITGQDEANFTRAARRERTSRSTDTDEDKAGRRSLRSPKITRNHRVVQDGTEKKEAANSHRHARPDLTPHIPKMAARLDESPDVLQVAATTSARSKRLFAGPSKSPPLSAPPGKRVSLQRFIVPGFLNTKDCEAEVVARTKTCYFPYRDPLLSKDAVLKISIQKIIRIEFPGDNGGANLVRLSLSTGVLCGNQCFLDFGTSEKACSDFTALILELSPGIKQHARKR